MNKGIKKLSLSRETVQRLDAAQMQGVAAGAGRLTRQESICFCITDVCASEGYTLCVLCEM